MSSKEIKKYIVNNCDYNTTSTKDWKRVAKRSVTYCGSQENLRTFTNSKTNQSVWVIGDDEDSCVHFPAGTVTYDIGKFSSYGEDSYYISFTPLGHHAPMWDQHCIDLILAVFKFPDWVELFEEEENVGVIQLQEPKTISDLEIFLNSVGMIKQPIVTT